MGASRRWLWVAWLLVPAGAGADAVHLKNGGVVRGVIVERTVDTVVMEVGPGRIALPLARIDRIDDSVSAVAIFHERLATLAFDDVDGLAGLARWAADHDLATYSRETWHRVLALDPGHPEANAALGRTFHDGQWMSGSDAYRLQGYVPFEGEWVTPAEHEALLRERAERERATTERREAELRVREAEARAREAEARAWEAEAYADQGEEPVEGIPYWWVLAGGGAVWPPGGAFPGPPKARPRHPVPPAVRPPSTIPNRGRSIWGSSGSARPPVARPHGGVKGSGSGRLR